MTKLYVLKFVIVFSVLIIAENIYAQVDLSKGLVAWYSMNGNAKSSVGTGLDLTVNGATLGNDRFGHPNSAYYFNGSSTLVGNLNTTGYAGISISGWINTAMSSSYGVFFQGTSSFVFYLNRFSAGHYMAAFDANTSNNSSKDESSTFVSTGKWLFVSASNDGTTTRIYVNGNLENSYSESLVTSNGQIYVGGTSGGTNMFVGAVDEMRVYNRQLSNAEMAALYVADCPDDLNLGLIAWYPMRGSAINALGTGMDMVVNGATLTTDRFGRPNSAYYFDGNSTLLTNFNSSTFSGVTYAAWIKTNLTTKYQVFIQSSSAFVGYINRFTAGHYMAAFDANTNNNNSTDESSTNVATDKWIFVSASNDGTTTRLYVNGVFEHSYPEVLATINSQLEIGGAVGSTTTQFVGSIDEVSIYNRALCDDEMLSLYKASNTGINTPQFAGDMSFEIFPNPSDGDFIVKTNGMEGNAISTICDINGKMIIKRIVNSGESAFHPDHLNKGIYFITLQTLSGVSTRKIVVE